MIDAPTDNVKLTFDQLQAIDTTQKRLAVLESEIVNATKVLKGTKMEADRATKENIYQNELLSKVTLEVETKQKELDNITNLHEDFKSKINVLSSEISTKTNDQAILDSKFKDREEAIKNKEIELADKEQQINDKSSQIDEKEVDFIAKVAKLKIVIDTF